MPYHLSYAAVTQESGLSAWQPDRLHAFGTPRSRVRSGRGTRMLWSARMWTTMKGDFGMWQDTQSVAGLGFPFHSGLWKWWTRPSYASAGWHCRQTPFPSFRSFRECASWQSVQRTPSRNIALWTNEPYSKSSSRICPSAW